MENSDEKKVMVQLKSVIRLFKVRTVVLGCLTYFSAVHYFSLNDSLVGPGKYPLQQADILGIGNYSFFSMKTGHILIENM